jgi:hypothetical protein
MNSVYSKKIEKSSSSLSKAHICPQIEFFAGASYLKASRGGEAQYSGGGIKGKIKGFSFSSRRRLMDTINKIDLKAKLPCFVTLTYPNSFPDAKTSKNHISIFRRRLDRKFSKNGTVWKLEPQMRGAPHYHLMVWGASLMDLILWIPYNWYAIAGGGDELHLKWHLGLLGNGNKPCVQEVYSWNGVRSYASKYLGKTFEVAGWGNTWVGRFWGVWNKENIPFGERVIKKITWLKAVGVMRYQRRFLKGKIKFTNNRSVTTYCNADHWVKQLNL